MESVLKCLVRDSQALGRGFGHIKQLSQTSLGTYIMCVDCVDCLI